MATRAPTPAALRRQRLEQIEQAYWDRLRPDMSRAEFAALDREYDRQVRLAEDAYAEARQPTYAPPSKQAKKRVSHAKKASRFWKHFARDGRPVPPWEISVGPGLDIDTSAKDYTGSIWDDPLFAEGEYSYEDFDTDWGGYEFEDTGYPNENT